MNTQRLIASLEHFPSILRSLVEDLTDEELRRKPTTGAWSVLEVLVHLADEEVEDFRTRVRMTLEDPTQDWPGIDPEAAARERRYNEQDPAESLTRFETERATSIDWLRSLRDPDWQRHRNHPVAGRLHAGDVLASWVAHDMLHLRQIAKRRFELIGVHSDPYNTAYAGDWRA